MALKKILVTRPTSQGAVLCERLRKLGYSAHSVPVLETEALWESAEQERIRRCFSEIQQYVGIIVVSLNAAEQAILWLKKNPPAEETQIFAVGKSTAHFFKGQHVANSQLEQKFKEIIYPSENMSSEGLLALPQLQAEQIGGKRYLILRGIGGRETIANTLMERGAIVDGCELYRRYLPVENAELLKEHLPEADIVVVNSGESLENLLTLTDESVSGNIFEKMLVVPGARVAEIARQLGFRHIITAANATDDAVADALLSVATL